MILPPFVGAIEIKQIFGQYGAANALIIGLGLRPHGWTFDWFAANQFWGIAIVEGLSLYPIIYLNVSRTGFQSKNTGSPSSANKPFRWTWVRAISSCLLATGQRSSAVARSPVSRR